MKILLRSVGTGLWAGYGGGWKSARDDAVAFASFCAAMEHAKQWCGEEVDVCYVFDNPQDDFEISTGRHWLAVPLPGHP